MKIEKQKPLTAKDAKEETPRRQKINHKGHEGTRRNQIAKIAEIAKK